MLKFGTDPKMEIGKIYLEIPRSIFRQGRAFLNEEFDLIYRFQQRSVVRLPRVERSCFVRTIGKQSIEFSTSPSPIAGYCQNVPYGDPTAA